MPVATVTITDITQKPASILQLISQSMQPQAFPSGTTLTGVPGYSVVTAAAGRGFSAIGAVVYLSIQFSPASQNSGITGFIGDEGVNSSGTLQAKEVLAGDVDVHQAYWGSVHLGEIFIFASANNAKFNLEWHYA